MATLTATEYQELKAFLRFFTERHTNLANISPEHHPLFVLEQMELKTPSRAKQGLRMAVNDCIEQSSHWSNERLVTLDQELAALGILSLSQIWKRYSKKYEGIIKRGRIRSEVELYLAQGILADQSLTVSADERANLEQMVEAYAHKTL